MHSNILQRIVSSTTPYIIALVIAVVLLLLMAGFNYKQIKNLQTSADLVSHSLVVDKEINNLFSQYSLMESAEFRSVILKDSIFRNSYIDYKLTSDRALKNLYDLTKGVPEYRTSLDTVIYLKDKLHATLTGLHGKVTPNGSDSTVMAVVTRAAALVKRLRGIKTEMLLKKEALLEESLASYDKQTTLTPLTSLFVALFSLGVFIVAFIKLRNHKFEIQSSNALLSSIVQSTDNIMNYYEPLYDKKGEIFDFKIIFANDCNRKYLGLEPQKIVGKPISKIYPFLLYNGEIEKMISGFKKGETINFERQVALNGEKFYFHSIIKPIKKGILVVVYNKTQENNAHERILTLNEQLKVQNVDLEKAREFLRSTMESTDNMINRYQAVRDDQKNITDFNILYATENTMDLIGLAPNDVVGKSVKEVYPFLMDSGAFDLMVESIKAQNKMIFEQPIIFKGTTHWMRYTLVPIGDRVTSTAADITKDKLAEENLTKLNQQLEIQNSIMSEAKRMAKIGSYTWHKETNSTEISDNFYRILGYEPNEFLPSFQKYRSLVHPEDLKRYDQFGQKAIENIETTEYAYRAITKDGSIKHLRTKSKFVKRAEETVMIGVVLDVTDQITTEFDLRIKNAELKRSNIELDSFNRVASHDLQEPLRKIQLFMSRFSEVDKKKLSKKGIEYFEKINNAAARMQSLIRNLLDYSRIDSAHEDFENVDLNTVVNKIIEDFAEPIKDAKAKIVLDKLPHVQGVFFQMEQLFSNLIANSLKYHNPGTAPKIILKSEKVHQKRIPEDFIKHSKHYFKITFIDNGIGFSNENADKIFEVFQRLHQNTEYSGTGIGLAICKKIIENHHGYIHATGELGKGSAFIVYLPA